MNILVAGGFLNSGKTSVIIQLLKYIIDNSLTGKKIIILENELGKAVIEENDKYVIEKIITGCACCSTSEEMVSLISKDMKEYEPEWLILEANGISIPENIRYTLKAALGLDSRLIFIADGQRWKRLKRATGTLFADQIKGADAVIINKTDLASEDELSAEEADIRGINETAALYMLSAKDEIPSDICGQILGW